MTSSYHEHTGAPCAPGPHPSCPDPAGTIFCEQVDENLFGCTHVSDTALTGAPLEALAESLAASYRTASIAQAAEAELGDSSAVAGDGSAVT